jgi:FdhD protein
MQSESVFIANETTLAVFFNDVEIATLICSPSDYKELAVGFLLSRGLLRCPSDIREITCREGEGLLWVQAKSLVPATEGFLHCQIASSCDKARPLLYFVNFKMPADFIVDNLTDCH